MTAPISCLIVDDEPIARDIIITYCGHLDYLQVVGSCENAIQAKRVLQEHKVDILFLDINMPIIDGISFVKTLKAPPQLIFTTAYKEYALDAFDLSACDYLHKPFSFERFMIAIDKAAENIKNSTGPKPAVEDEKNQEYLFIKTDGKIFKVQHDDILFAEAKGNYTSIVTNHQTLLPAMTFSNFEQLLPAGRFLRVHRSYIINKSKISHIEGNRVFIGKNEIPIGSNFKEEFLRELGI